MRCLIISLLFVCNYACAIPYKYKVTRVIDGDTVEFQALFLPEALPQVLSLRIEGIDTPEKGGRAGCGREKQLGVSAYEFTKNAIETGKNIRIDIRGWDKYGGRVIGDVLINGSPLSKMLIEKGLARPYDGKSAKSSWCN